MHEPAKMMKCPLSWLQLVLLFSLISFSRINGYPSDLFKDKNDNEEGELKNVRPSGILTEMLEKIFGFESQSEMPPHQKVLPEFMVELYNTVADSNGVMQEINPYNANIIRTVIETNSSLPHLYFFNISGLERNELIIEAELHLYKKETPLENISPLRLILPYYHVVNVFQVLDNRSLDVPRLHKLLNVNYFDAIVSGWQVFNVTQAVLGWMNGEPNLGLLVVGSKIHDNDIDIDFVRRNECHYGKPPILVLFDDDNTEHYSKKNITPPYYAHDNYENKKYFDYEDERKEDDFYENYFNTRKEQQGQLEEAQLVNSKFEIFQRQKRKEENKLNFPHYQRKYTLERRRRDAYKRLSPKIALENTKILTSMDIYNETQLQNRLEMILSKYRMESNRTEWINQYREQRSFNDNNNDTNNNNKKKKKQQNEIKCQKQQLYIDFADMGLDEYVIAPAGYSTYQCSSVCEINLKALTSPQNTDSFACCCMPTKLSSLSVLLARNENTVIMKKYENVIVEECGCI